MWVPINPAAPPKADAPISGVAQGSLGTAANLDDTQVMPTEDLRAAAAAAIATAASAPRAAAIAAPRTGSAPAVQAVRPTPWATQRRGSQRRPGNVAALAGVLAVMVLLAIAGSGILSQLDFGAAAMPGISADAATEAAPSPTAIPKPQPNSAGRGGQGGGGGNGGGHGPKGCHGHGHGHGCGDGGD